MRRSFTFRSWRSGGFSQTAEHLLKPLTAVKPVIHRATDAYLVWTGLKFMLCRTSTLNHPLGVRLETPLLVPSFSSKGFGKSKKGKSEVREILETARQYLTSSMLISAYDLYYGYLPLPTNAVTEILVLDSGGYEVSNQQDLSGTFFQPGAAQAWTEGMLRSVLTTWPPGVPAIFVSYDHPDQPQTLSKQVKRARALVRDFPDQLHCFLAKPEKGQTYVPVDRLAEHASELNPFAVLGLTEKELGGSFGHRLENLAKLRLALDEAGLQGMPIHIFGSLDPISVCLYFVAGAEIFDGLTWLRYGYYNGLAVYKHNVAALLDLITRRDSFIAVAMLQANLSELEKLVLRMRKFAATGNFQHFSPHENLAEQAVEFLRTRIRRGI